LLSGSEYEVAVDTRIGRESSWWGCTSAGVYLWINVFADALSVHDVEIVAIRADRQGSRVPTRRYASHQTGLEWVLHIYHGYGVQARFCHVEAPVIRKGHQCVRIRTGTSRTNGKIQHDRPELTSHDPCRYLTLQHH